MAPRMQSLSFPGSHGATLAARLDLPAGPVRAYALFAHCFTCSKDLAAARRIAGELTRHGIAVLRFDFTGLGSSEGEFASTDFSSNVGDLHAAIDYLRQHFEAPSLLIGHSLGGAAVLVAAPDVPEVKAVAVIGAPSDAEHVIQNFHCHVERIEEEGKAEVELAGRTFTIRKEFLDDLRQQTVRERIGHMHKALLVLHAPLDNIVGIDNATEIFIAARHPKSFVSLDTADHLLSDAEDGAYAANVISAWASRFIKPEPEVAGTEPPAVRVVETGEGKFQNLVQVGRHRLFADEPEKVGGLDTGPSPYDYLSIALGACTTMTLRLYAEHKGLPVERVSVDVLHAKVHAEDCGDCAEKDRERGGRIDRFERRISIDGDLDADTRERMRQIADRCPVHKTLTTGASVVTVLAEED
ncbi:MAG: osmotically inducible protein C [Hyphomicrobiales bacterium]|nr:MAG: osmotically inducible protein C [Hyphomicrobiales bacterium]